MGVYVCGEDFCRVCGCCMGCSDCRPGRCDCELVEDREPTFVELYADESLFDYDTHTGFWRLLFPKRRRKR